MKTFSVSIVLQGRQQAAVVRAAARVLALDDRTLRSALTLVAGTLRVVSDVNHTLA